MNNANDFTTGKIFPKMIHFMIPILGALILQAMYGAVDILIVGWFGSDAGISAVSTGSNIVNLVIFTVAGLSMGVTILIGRYIGEKREQRIGKVIGGAIAFFSTLSVAIAILMLVFARNFAMLMQAPDSAIYLTTLYVRICGGGIFFIIAYNLISSIFRGMGNSKLPLVFVGIACVSNIFLDLLFVAGFNMNVVGAALATVMAQAISVIISIVIIMKQELPFEMKREDISFNEEIRRFLFLGAPIGFQEILTQLSFLALCAFINKLGLEASSGYGVANKIVSFVMLVPGSLMQSMSAFVAQNVGANLEKRARQAMVNGILIGISIGVFITMIAFFEGSILSSVFTKNADYIEKSAEYLKGFALEAMLTPILFSFMGYFNGHGKTIFVMSQGIAQTFLVRLPMSYFMSIRKNANLTEIGLAAPTATVFGILINIIYYIIIYKKMKNSSELNYKITK